MRSSVAMPGGAAAAVAMGGLLSLLVQLPGAAGTGGVVDVPEPNWRPEACTPRCSSTAEKGAWRCDTTADGEEICHTLELEDPHTCHFHFYEPTEVAQCMQEQDPDMVIAFLGGSHVGGLFATAFPWLDEQYDNDLDVHDWLFDGQPPSNPNLAQYTLLIRCAGISITPEDNVLTKGGALEYDECIDVYTKDPDSDGAPEFLWGSGVSVEHLIDRMDDMIAAGRTDMSGYFVFQVDVWYDLCNDPGNEPWACDAMPDGEEIRALRGTNVDTRLEFYYSQMRKMADKMRDNFPNITPVFARTVVDWGEFTAGAAAIAELLVDEYNGILFNIEGTMNEPNAEEKVGNHPVGIVNLALVQRLISVVCEADKVEIHECEEQWAGSEGCRTYEWSEEEGPGIDWWEQYHRPCEVTVFPTEEQYEAEETGSEDEGEDGGAPEEPEEMDFSQLVLDQAPVASFASATVVRTADGQFVSAGGDSPTSSGREYTPWKYTALKWLAACLSLVLVVYTFVTSMPAEYKARLPFGKSKGGGLKSATIQEKERKLMEVPKELRSKMEKHNAASAAAAATTTGRQAAEETKEEGGHREETKEEEGHREETKEEEGAAQMAPSSSVPTAEKLAALPKAIPATAAAGAAGAAGMGMGAWGYLTAFDGARFVASQHIVGGHYFGTSPQATPRWYIIGWGFTWVPWFMMLSGFVLTYSSLKRQAKSGQVGVYPNPWTFLQARVKSIYPLYLLGLIAAFFVSVWDDRWQNITWLEAVASVTLTQAWIPKITENVLQAHCWFLSAIVPLWFFHGRMEKFMSNLSNKALVALMVALSVAGWLPAIIPPIVGEPADWYRVHSYGSTKMWEDMFVVMLKFFPAFYAHVYIYGIGLACLYRNYREAAPALFRFGACIGYAGLLLVFTVEAIQPPGYKLTCRLGALAPLQGLILIGLAFGVDPVAKLFNLWPFRVLGRYSYSVYIFQFIAFNIWSGWADMGMMTFLLAFAIVMFNVSGLLFPTKDNSVFWKRLTYAGVLGLALTSLWGIVPTPVSGEWGEDNPNGSARSGTPVAAEVSYPSGATDTRLDLSTSVPLGVGSSSTMQDEYDFINPSLLEVGDKMFMAARRHRMEFDTTPDVVMGETDAGLLTTTWFSDIVFGEVEPSTLQPTGEMTVMNFAPSAGEEKWTPCIPEPIFFAANNTYTQHVVTGPQDPRLLLHQGKLLMTFFSTLPNQDEDKCPASGDTIGGMFITEGDLLGTEGGEEVIVANMLQPDPAATTPQIFEKNWMAFGVQTSEEEAVAEAEDEAGSIGFLTHASPFTPVRSSLENHAVEQRYEEVVTPLLYFKDSMGVEIHGGSNAVLVERSFLDDYNLAVFHTLSATGEYINYFMQFTTEEPFHPLAISRPIPLLSSDPEACPIFASGLTKLGKDHVVVSYGSCDEESRALTLSWGEVSTLLRHPVGSGEFDILNMEGVMGVGRGADDVMPGSNHKVLNDGVLALVILVGFVLLTALFLLVVVPCLGLGGYGPSRIKALRGPREESPFIYEPPAAGGAADRQGRDGEAGGPVGHGRPPLQQRRHFQNGGRGGSRRSPMDSPPLTVSSGTGSSGSSARSDTSSTFSQRDQRPLSMDEANVLNAHTNHTSHNYGQREFMTNNNHMSNNMNKRRGDRSREFVFTGPAPRQDVRRASPHNAADWGVPVFTPVAKGGEGTPSSSGGSRFYE